VLFESYTAEMTSVSSLVRTLDAIGSSLSPEDAAGHLVYLAQQVTCRSGGGGTCRSSGAIASNTSLRMRFCSPSWRQGDAVAEGRIAEDPMIAF